MWGDVAMQDLPPWFKTWLKQKGEAMFIMDVPPEPIREVPVLMAQVDGCAGVNCRNARPDPVVSAVDSAQKYDRAIGVCHLSANPYEPLSAVNSMSVADEAVWYLKEEDHYRVEGQSIVSVLKMPAHGSLLDGGRGNYAYLPEKGYLGIDRATLLVEVGGKKVKMEYFFRVMKSVVESDGEDIYAEFCPEKVRVWKISNITDSNGTNFITAIDFNSTTIRAADTAAPDAVERTSILGTGIQSNLAVDTSSITLEIADLPRIKGAKLEYIVRE